MFRRIFFLSILLVIMIVLATSTVPADARPSSVARSAPIVVDHRHTDISQIPEYWINQAKELLRLSYGHTSHGSQLVTGMDAIRDVNSLFDYNTNGAIAPGILSLRDTTPSGDLGAPDRVTWAALTRTYLNGPTGTGPSRNVTMWSWCGQASSATQTDIITYLNLMDQLETDYPAVNFVYMTGHLDGTGEAGNLKIRNQQIRNYVLANNKVLFDFADIESYDPAGNYYPNESDACSWCTTWCSSHPGDCTNLPASGSCAHSHEFNCWRKGQAFWWLMARLAGWAGPDIIISGNAEVVDATLSYTDGTPKTATTDGNGDYSFTVPSGWTGTITPSKPGYIFSPASINITTPLAADLPNQDFSAKRSTPADFDGDEDSDVSVYKVEPWGGMWYIKDQSAHAYGNSESIPVSCDYNGDGTTDVAVYNAGTWYVKDQFVDNWGDASSIPVPGDYDGDGACELAVYKVEPWGGMWYLQGMSAHAYGNSESIPVPADYNGDGVMDVAVYNAGTWYVKDQFVDNWGDVNSIPVPGDYNGDGTDDLAVYKVEPWGGMWYIKDQSAHAYGNSESIPVPGDYNGDGMMDVAVYNAGTWYVKDQFVDNWGDATSFPLPVRDTNGDGDPYQ